MSYKKYYGIAVVLMITTVANAMLVTQAKRVFFKKPFSRSVVLHNAIRNDQSKEIYKQVINNPNSIHIQDAGGYYPLHYVQSLYPTQLLLDAGANPNAGNKLNETPLYTVPHYIVHLLIENGASIHIPSNRTLFVSDKCGYIPLTPFRNAVLLSDLAKFNYYNRQCSIDTAEYYIVYAIACCLSHLPVNSVSDNAGEKHMNASIIKKILYDKLSKDL